jgi:hypothetical protein
MHSRGHALHLAGGGLEGGARALMRLPLGGQSIAKLGAACLKVVSCGRQRGHLGRHHGRLHARIMSISACSSFRELHSGSQRFSQPCSLLL